MQEGKRSVGRWNTANPDFSFPTKQSTSLHRLPLKHGVRKDRVFAQLCAISSMEKATASLNYDEHHSAHRLPRWQKKPLCQLSVRAGVRVNSCRSSIIPCPEPRRFFSPFIFSRATKQTTEKRKRKKKNGLNQTQ